MSFNLFVRGDETVCRVEGNVEFDFSRFRNDTSVGGGRKGLKDRDAFTGSAG